jgi:hypothetical protein
MLALMLDPRLKNIWLVTTYLRCENVVIVVEYNEKFILLLLTKKTKLLMPTSVEEDEDMKSQSNVENIFHITSTNVNIHWGLVPRELVRFHQYLVNVENYKFTLFWWHK